jgi:tRNA (guanosine-2'-O-)-methyltransferase
MVFGREADGVSEEMIQAADQLVYFPLHGFSESLNLSVSAALILAYVLEHQPLLQCVMQDSERSQLRREWFLKLAKRPGQQETFPQWATSQTTPRPFDDLRRSSAMR